jgi:hypothetical protein
MKAPVAMNTASSTPPSSRSGAKDKTLRALDRLALAVAPSAFVARHASGVYRMGDEFAGLERLDRVELDETDED